MENWATSSGCCETLRTVFDSRMALHLVNRIRPYDLRGFTGFEGRHYSLFESWQSDFANAVNLQVMITAPAYQLIAARRFSHADMPIYRITPK